MEEYYELKKFAVIKVDETNVENSTEQVPGYVISRRDWVALNCIRQRFPLVSREQRGAVQRVLVVCPN